MKIFVVPTGLDEKKVIEDIIRQNFGDFSPDEFGASFKQIFKVIPRKMPIVHWVVEVAT